MRRKNSWSGWLGTKVPGALDPEYVLARQVLLDALQALGEQRSAVVLVGAQAIYLHTGDADLAVAPYTTDGDVVIDSSRLRDDPTLAEALRGASFSADTQHVGTWVTTRTKRGSGWAPSGRTTASSSRPSRAPP